MHKTSSDKRLVDRAKLTRAWRKWHDEQFEEALAGMHRSVFERLMEQLEDLRSARELLNHVASEDWSVIDQKTRAIALFEINRAITQLREKSGLPPIDDAIGDEPLRAFAIIKKLINRFPAPAGKPAAGRFFPADDGQ